MATKLLEPPEEAIMVGYALMRGHQALQGTTVIGKDGARVIPPHMSDYYILEAARCLPLALTAVNKILKDAGKTELFHHAIGGAEDLIGAAYEATVNRVVPYPTRYRCGGQMKLAHDLVSTLMADNGFRPITDRDFAKYGDGGGR